MTLCDGLDDYVADALVADDHLRFAAHLPDCPACRQAVEKYERLSALLTTAAVELAPVPAGLTDRIRGRLRTARRRRIMTTAGALAAAVAFAVWLHVKPVEPIHSPAVPPGPVAVRPSEPVRITFPRGDMLAVPEPMSSPNVTFVWIYPRLGGDARPIAKRSN